MSISALTFLASSPAMEGQTFGAFDGTTNSILATFVDPAQVGSYRASLQWGDGSLSTDLGQGGTLMVLPDSMLNSPGHANQFDIVDLVGHVYPEESITPQTLRLVVANANDSSDSASATKSLIVHDAPLSVIGVKTINAVEGQAFQGQVATFTDADPGARLGDHAATIDWGDGTTSVGVISQPAGAGTSFVVSGTHTYAHWGSSTDSSPAYAPVTVTVVDTDGQAKPSGTRASGSAQDQINVADAPLSPAPSQTAFSGQEGIASSGVVARFVDANPNGQATDFSGTIDWGDGRTTAFPSAYAQVGLESGTTFRIFATHAYAEEGTWNLSIHVRDAGGASTDLANIAKIADAPLSPGTGGKLQAVEGQPGSFSLATFVDANPNAPTSDFSGVITWGDGTTSTFGPGNVSLVARTTTQATFRVTASHTYAEDGNYIGSASQPVQVTINDAGGGSTTVDFSAVVADAPLHAQSVVIPKQVESVGFSNVVVGRFLDEDPAGQASDYEVTILWGDGSAPTVGTVKATGIDPATGFASFEVLGTHSPLANGSNHGYVEEGTYQVTMQVVDIDDHLDTLPGVPRSFSSATSQVVVQDAPLTGTWSPFPATAGIPISGQQLARFTDGNLQAPLSDYPSGNVTIDWGDGSTSTGTVNQPGGTGTPFLVAGDHIYFEPGTYPVRVTIHDKGGAQLVLSGSETVQVAPLLATAVDFSAVEGSLVNVTLATFTNANPFFSAGDPPGSSYSATISWGDGTTSSATIQPDPISSGRFDVMGTHTYAEDGLYTASVAITSTQGATTTGPVTSTATVKDAPLTGSAVTFKPIEGLSFTGTVATFTDADPGGHVGDYSAIIDWGDGAPG
ncbi:MAG TPA: hypothetical protein VFT74_17825, partial [Isosphaeraceae bacterium]|nr:hypothetical protein [Isosphaeraceae bacterium]